MKTDDINEILMTFDEGQKILALYDMIHYLILVEDLAFNKETGRIYWTANGETLGMP